MSIRMQVLKVYKNLLKSTRTTFQNDPILIREASKEIKKKFNENKFEQSSTKIEEFLKIANQTEVIIRRNVVQGNRREGTDVFELNLTSDKEINLNETIVSQSKCK